ncbi:MAG: hypothetical protein RMY36_029815 [Nostoc sp. SerVER01]|nr:hypothetical protein [Nostoc sp. SerVER01]MDZ8079038.1 hypothetical protein [Nostoc sp. DcaGUA01]
MRKGESFEITLFPFAFNRTVYAMRSLDTVKVKGKSELITVYQVFDADTLEIKQAKLTTKNLFEQPLVL